MQVLRKSSISLLRSAPRGYSAAFSAVAVTPETLRGSAGRMLDYYVARQLPSGGLEGCEDPCHYCKLPNALVWGGRVKEADAMLDFCVDEFMRPNGDFTLCGADGSEEHFAPLEKKTLHWQPRQSPHCSPPHCSL